MKRIFGVIVGVAIAFLLVSAVDWIGAALFPTYDTTFGDPYLAESYVANLPFAAKLIVVGAWLIAPLGGAWLALRIADWRPGGRIVVALFLAAGLMNQVTLPHPVWMQISAVVLPLIGGWLAQRFHRKPYPGEPLLG